MMNELEGLDGAAFENALWVIGMNLHNEPDDKQRQYLEFIGSNHPRLGGKLFFRCLTNILHVFYANMTAANQQLYLELFLSIDPQTIDGIAMGEILEILGILVKGCTPAQTLQVFHYVQTNAELCLKDPSALVSACNCFRYLYPEIPADSQKTILDMISNLKVKNSYRELDTTLNFTFHSLQEVSV